jgi:hypothetical protein
MKKYSGAIAAILVLLLIATPVVASADVIDVQALQISDPIVAIDGEPFLDMTGLSLQFAGGSTADGSLTQLFFDVFAGDQNANSALLQIDENGVAGLLGGMTSAYGVSMEAAESLALGMEVDLFGYQSIEDFAAALENWTLMDDLAARVEAFAENEIAYGEPEEIEIELAAGTATMIYIPMTADATEYTLDIIRMMAEDELLAPMFAESLAESGYASVDEMLNDLALSYQVSGGVAVTEDGMSTLIDLSLHITVDDEPGLVDIYMLLDGSMGETQYVDITSTVSSDDEDDVTVIAVNGIIEGEEFWLDGSINELDDDEDEVEMTFSVGYATAAGAGEGYNLFELSFAEPGEAEFILSGYASPEGEWYASVAFADEYADSFDAYISYVPAEPYEGARHSGNVELGVSDGATMYSLAGTVHLIETTIDTDDFYIDPANVIDIMSMTDEQSEIAEQEIGLALISTLTVIEKVVPGLAGLTSSLLFDESGDF